MTYEPDFAYYRDVYRGGAGEKAFNAALPGSLALVRDLIGFNEVTDETADAFKRAVCAASEVAFARGTGGGFTIGSFSMSGDTPHEVRADMARAAKAWLVGTGLLFQGVR